MACDGLFVIVILLVIVIAVRHAVLGLQNDDYEHDYEYDYETAHTAGRSIGLANVRRFFMNNPGYSSRGGFLGLRFGGRSFGLGDSSRMSRVRSPEGLTPSLLACSIIRFASAGLRS